MCLKSLDECYETNKLDCAQYFTPSNRSVDAFLRTCKADLHLFTESVHLDMVEKMIRGGIASFSKKKLVSDSNKSVEKNDPKQPSIFLFVIDANSLYGGSWRFFFFHLTYSSLMSK